MVIAIAFLLPLYLMVSGALRETGAPSRTPELVPWPLAWENFSTAFDLVDIPRYTVNSLIVVAFAVPLTVLTASWAAFAMTRLPRRWAGALIYRNGFAYLHYGYAAAATVSMFLITAAIVYVQYRIVKRWRHSFVV